jgi:hypothetical protein
MLDGTNRSNQPRKCGTCRFYQPSPIEGAGWCRNLLRVGKDDLVLVRRWELACRNGWGKDDWQPAGAGKNPHHPVHASPQYRASTLEPKFQSTVRPEEIPSWPNPRPTPQGVFTEKLVGGQQRGDLSLSLSRDELLPDCDTEPTKSLQDLDQLRRKWRQAAIAEYPGKRCANCAFFVSTAPGKGMCRNRFAFERDTAVNPADLACLSTLGHWWQPRSNLLLGQDVLPQVRGRP